MENKHKMRQRGVILTDRGRQKLQAARQRVEMADNGGDRFTLEDLGDRTGLSLKTIAKVLDTRSSVDKPTLEAFFQAFQLLLERQDYRYPSSEPADRSISPTNQIDLPQHPSLQVDWGEAPDVSMFHGRQPELAQLHEWLQPQNNRPRRLIAILGMGGMGKTTLATKFLHDTIENQSSDRPFEYIIWRSLRNAPTLEVLLSQWLSIFSDRQETQPSLSKLLYYLQNYRCLLVLDNLETILSGISGTYRQGYENYGELLTLIGETNHQSSAIVTSREKTTELNTLAGENLPVCCLSLKGSDEASLFSIRARGLQGTIAQQQQLCDRYGKNPLAVKIIAATIHELFDGDIAAFLQEEGTIFPGIRRLLAQQFARLSPLERAIMFWLAIDRDWTTINELSEDILPPVSRGKILEAIEQLHWRSLIEKKQGRYTQQPVVMEYTTEHLVERIGAELLAMPSQSPTMLHHYAPLKTTVKDYVRDSQSSSIVTAIVRELQASLGAAAAIGQHLKICLESLRPEIPPNTEFTPEPSYAAGSILNLLCHLPTDLKGCDCAGLAVWHAYLPNIPLHQVNFSHADLGRSQLTDTFGAVFSLAFSPDGTMFATGELNGYLRLWRASTGEVLWAVQACQSWIFSVAFSPDGRMVVVGTGTHTIECRDVATGRSLRSLIGHRDQIHCVAFHPTDELLASASADRTVRLWQVATGTCLHEFTGSDGHVDRVQSVCFSPQGNLLVSGSSDRTIKVWDTQTRTLRQTLLGHEDQVFGTHIHPQGKILVSSCADTTLKLWDLDSGKCLNTLRGHLSHVLAVQFSPDGKRIVSSSSDRTIRLWDCQTGQLLQTLYGHSNSVSAVKFDPQGDTLLSGSSDYTIKLWQIETNRVLHTWLGHSNWIWSVQWSPDGKQVISGGGDRTVRVWDSQTGGCQQTLRGHQNWVLSAAWDRTGTFVASGSGDNAIKLWQANCSTSIATMTGHTAQVTCVRFSPTQDLLASSSSDYTIRLWSVPEGRLLRVLAGHQDWSRSISFSPDGQTIASAGQDATVKLWQVSTGDCLQTLSEFDTWVWGVAFHPQGDRLLTAAGGTIELWDVATGKRLRTYRDRTKWVRSIDISPNGRWFASGAQDRLVHLWDLATGDVLQTFGGHLDQVLSVQFSPDDRYLVSSSADETIRIWEIATGELLQMLQPEGLYAGMKIAGIRGLTEGTIATLLQLGADDRL
jgi:WD40 repeat protein